MRTIFRILISFAATLIVLAVLLFVIGFEPGAVTAIVGAITAIGVWKIAGNLKI